MCAVAVLDQLENLNCAVQSSSKSVASVVTAMKMTVGTLNDLRDEATDLLLDWTAQLLNQAILPERPLS